MNKLNRFHLIMVSETRKVIYPVVNQMSVICGCV